MNITTYSVESIRDPFGILSGKRYEFIIDLEVDEEDELYSELGVYLRVIYRTEEDKSGTIVSHELHERNTERYLDFELEEDELEEVLAFCAEHAHEADGA